MVKSAKTFLHPNMFRYFIMDKIILLLILFITSTNFDYTEILVFCWYSLFSALLDIFTIKDNENESKTTIKKG